ncbi:hypothetical protein SAMN06296416_104342 [Pseudoxanthomonas wuyuanensis]|uniref:Tetratricopeptide repeat-containing protein n=1 Tax=Pseudoxanthomonas wuyuanensis TaxID=1073196 RepID=A0A286D7V0_9GAMM|nr:hypothetical protein SAMN06296416_104342 [Pseudoxanthomonas wuyuanensis]
MKRERESGQSGRDGRIEPLLDWSDVRFSAGTAKRPHPITHLRRRLWPWWLGVAVVLIAVALVAYRQPLTGWLWPETRVQRLLDEAESALREGRLSATDGRGARQLFEAAQALDTDRTEARSGLMRVAEAALAQAQRALGEERFADARSALALARELQVPRAQADRLAEALRRREAEMVGLDDLLKWAQQAHAAARLEGGPDAALPLYQRVLSLQPDRVEALEGREDALSDLLQQAGAALAKGDLVDAAAIIARVRGYDAGHIELPDAQAGLGRSIEQRLTRAAADLRRQRLDAALAGYQAVLDAAPDNAVARQGSEQVATIYAERAGRLAADQRFSAAQASLEKARVIAPRSVAVIEAEQRIARARQALARQDSGLSAGERSRRVQSLLAAMGRAETQGNWLTPPGESAFDQLRAAQALAPDDAAVKRAAARLLAAIERCFEDELRSNRIRRAQTCLDAWQTLRPDASALRDAHQRLALKWVAVGDERLGAGDVAFAALALREAQMLAADAPGLADFAQRVRTAQAGGD